MGAAVASAILSSRSVIREVAGALGAWAGLCDCVGVSAAGADVGPGWAAGAGSLIGPASVGATWAVLAGSAVGCGFESCRGAVVEVEVTGSMGTCGPGVDSQMRSSKTAPRHDSNPQPT